MTTEINKYDDTIDSRDVIARIEELTEERNALDEELTDACAARDVIDTEEQTANPQAYVDACNDADVAKDRLDNWTADNDDELAALLALQSECESFDDWQHGAQLIRYSYFKEYAMSLAEDLGLINDNAQWPNTCIDWDQAASELQMDYSSVSFDGVDYWIR